MRAHAYSKILSSLRQPEDGQYRPKHVVVHYIVIKYTSCDTVVFNYIQFSKGLRMSENRAPRPGTGDCGTVHGVGLYDRNRNIKARDLRFRARSMHGREVHTNF